MRELLAPYGELARIMGRDHELASDSAMLNHGLL
jgi:hypothetical protein